MRKHCDEVLKSAQKVLHLFSSVTGIDTLLLPHYGLARETFLPCTLCRLLENYGAQTVDCKERLAEAGSLAANYGGRHLFLCRKGFVHFCVPVYCGNEHLATAVAGPCLISCSEIPKDRLIHSLISDTFQLPSALNSPLRTLPSRTPEEIFRLMEFFELSLLSFGQVHKSAPLPGGFLEKVETTLCSSLALGTKGQARKALSDAQELILSTFGKDATLCKDLCVEFSFLLARILSDRKEDASFNNALSLLFCSPTEKDPLGEPEAFLSKLTDDFFRILLPSLPETEHTVDSAVVRRVIEYVEENYAKDISLETAANAVFLSVPYLSRLFKAEYGTNFNHYLNEVRIRHAKKLLLVPYSTTSDVALSVGFENPSYFSKVFKRITGLTPRNYVLQCETEETDE